MVQEEGPEGNVKRGMVRGYRQKGAYERKISFFPGEPKPLTPKGTRTEDTKIITLNGGNGQNEI